ncbi:MAG: hypothetical protein ACE1Z1_03495, partial [Candidatus Acidiferrales bacterium]
MERLVSGPGATRSGGRAGDGAWGRAAGESCGGCGAGDSIHYRLVAAAGDKETRMAFQGVDFLELDSLLTEDEKVVRASVRQ